MSFTLPSFNLNVNIWRATSLPPAPPAVATVGNLAWGRRVAPPLSVEDVTATSQSMTLLLPPGTDIRGQLGGFGNEDLVEVPAGTKRYYTVVFVDDIGKGFPNEHRAVSMIQTKARAVPAWVPPYP